MRLGRLPHDPAAIEAAPSLLMAAALPPPKLDRSHIPFEPGLYQNDVLPNCTAVGLVNACRGIAWLNGADIVVEDGRVPAFYAQCIGAADSFDVLAASQGAVLLDVLARQARHSLDVGPQKLSGVYASVPLHRIALANAMNRLGVAYLGVDLFDRDMRQPFDWHSAARDEFAGGHCVIGWDYTGLGDHDTVRIGTWGMWVPATWLWLENRLQEAHVVAFRDLTKANGLEWSGVDYDTLRAQCLAA